MIDKNELDQFAEAMINAYKNTSLLKEISELKPYSGNGFNFFQIGHRTLLPMEFFEVGNKIDNTLVAGEFARSVSWGEVNFLIERLKGLAKERRIPCVNISKFAYDGIVEKILEYVSSATDIFIPIDQPYFNEVHNWISGGHARYDNGLHIILPNNLPVKVHWSSKFAQFEDVTVLDKNGIKIIQKKFEEINVPKELGKILYSYKPGEPLRLDFAESPTEPNQFDFYFRSVIALGTIDQGSVCTIGNEAIWRTASA